MAKVIGALVVLGVAAYFIVPKFRTEVNNSIESLKEWDDEARRKDPVGYIDWSMKKLQQNVGAFESLRGSIAAQKGVIEKRREEAVRKVSFGEKSAAEFKTAYQAAKKDGKWPATVAGRPYSESELKAQVGLTLGEIDGAKSILGQIDPILVELDGRLTDVVKRHADSKAKLDLLATQKELVKATQLTADTEKMLANVQDVLVQNEMAMQKSPVRTLDEMAKENAKAAAAANPAVDAFLNG